MRPLLTYIYLGFALACKIGKLFVEPILDRQCFLYR